MLRIDTILRFFAEKTRRTPTFAHPISQLASVDQIRDPIFEEWRIRFGMRPGLNRKLWEYLYIAQAIRDYIGFRPRRRVLGFGVGRERIPAVLANLDCEVLATDWPAQRNILDSSWAARGLDDLLHPLEDDWDPKLRDIPLCHPEVFRRNVTFQRVDMTDIPTDLRDFDALWSCGSLEHLGSLRAGLEFIVNAMQCLRPGGVAVHTTEFNVSSNEATIELPDICLYRRRDIEELVRALRRAGHRIAVSFWRPNTPENTAVDEPPFNYEHTMNARHGNHVFTSIGLIAVKGGRTFPSAHQMDLTITA